MVLNCWHEMRFRPWNSINPVMSLRVNTLHIFRNWCYLCYEKKKFSHDGRVLICQLASQMKWYCDNWIQHNDTLRKITQWNQMKFDILISLALTNHCTFDRRLCIDGCFYIFGFPQIDCNLSDSGIVMITFWLMRTMCCVCDMVDCIWFPSK